MKKKVRPNPFGGRKWSSLRDNLTPQQFQGIGEIIIAFNEAEGFVELILGTALDAPAAIWSDISTRISGIDGRLELIKKLLKPNVPAKTSSAIENTFAALKEYKSYRDAVAHATVFDANLGIGQTVRRQGEYIHVLLTEEALSKLCELLIAVRLEMIEVMKIALWATSNALTRSVGEQQRELKVQEWTAQLQTRQKERRSLKPLPTLPPEHAVLLGLVEPPSIHSEET